MSVNHIKLRKEAGCENRKRGNIDGVRGFAGEIFGRRTWYNIFRQWVYIKEDGDSHKILGVSEMFVELLAIALVPIIGIVFVIDFARKQYRDYKRDKKMNETLYGK